MKSFIMALSLISSTFTYAAYENNGETKIISCRFAVDNTFGTTLFEMRGSYNPNIEAINKLTIFSHYNESMKPDTQRKVLKFEQRPLSSFTSNELNFVSSLDETIKWQVQSMVILYFTQNLKNGIFALLDVSEKTLYMAAGPLPEYGSIPEDRCFDGLNPGTLNQFPHRNAR